MTCVCLFIYLLIMLKSNFVDYRCDLNLEVVDKNRISQVKVATIKRIVGKRLNITYYDSDPDDPGIHSLFFLLLYFTVYVH